MYIEGEVTIVKKFVKAIVCDCCKTEYRDDFELQEFLHFLNKGGISVSGHREVRMDARADRWRMDKGG